MSEKRYGPDAYFSLIRSLQRSGADYFLGGGQAVNYWSGYFRNIYGSSIGLDDFIPFVSKDCDLWVDYGAFRYFENAEGHLNKSESPADGQLAIYTIPGEEKLTVDLMTCIYGIPMHEIDRILKRAQTIDEIIVIDPIYLFKAKCSNFVGLPQGGRQDGKHVEMLLCILPAYFRTLLDAADSQEITDRQLIQELKFLRDLCKKDGSVKKVLHEKDLTTADLLPIAHFKEAKSQKLRDFAASPWI